jgi:hypothetical protein
LADEFGLKHIEIAKKMGKSREYVSNAMRILMLPEQILNGLTAGKISEGHTRSLLMLKDRPEEQAELYRRIVADKLTVRAAEKLARNIATDKIRKKVDLDPEIKDIENHIREKLGTKVSIDQKPLGDGGKLTIEYFSKDDLKKILAVIESNNIDIVENRDASSDVVADNFVSDKIGDENDSFEDIEPTVFKEEIEKIEQFGNVIPAEENNISQNQEFKAFSIKDDELGQNDNNQKEISNFSDNGGLKDFDLETKNKDIQSVNINNFDEKIDSSLDSNYGKDNKDLNYSVDGLEKIEINNDFDRSRIDSFAKTDEILNSFGNEEKEVITGSVNKQDNFSISPGASQEENIIDNQDKTENRQEEYSDLYAEFLKTKKSLEVENSENNKEKEVVVESLENDIKLDSADNFVVKKTESDLSDNIITDKNNSFNGQKDLEPVVDIITTDSSDFLAAAKEHSNSTENITDEDIEDNVQPVAKDDKYSFKGFSI